MKNIFSILVAGVGVYWLFVYWLFGGLPFGVSPSFGGACEKTDPPLTMNFDRYRNVVCIDGQWRIDLKTDKEMAIEAKAIKADYEKRFAEKEAFCGEDNVDEDSLFCKDYSLVPDDNIK